MLCKCGEKSTIHWQGEGDFCDACFYQAYNVPLIAKMTPEENKKRIEIEKRFEDRAHARGTNS